MNVCFETFGCRLNRAEALEREAECIARGWKIVESHADADVVIVRGCSVTARAQRECEKLISHIKRKYPFKRLIVEGCLANTTKTRAKDGYGDHGAAPLPTRTARAYLKVQDGCNGKCTFCIVPQFRGLSSSVQFADVLDKAKRFIDSGYREIVVTGCNLSLYASGGKRLPELVGELAHIGRLGSGEHCRIRIGSLGPGTCAMETVGCMAENDNVCRFLHIPVQSASNAVLVAMRRPYVLKDVESLVEKAVRLMPTIGIGCDLMTGFPGETEMDFIATKGLLRRLPFSNAHVFPYSERPNTLATAYLGVVPKEIRSARAHDLASESATNRLKFARRFIGKTVEIVVEDKEKCEGWTSEYLFCRANGNVPRKSIARVIVTKVHHNAELEGVLCK